jgi:hypothetical protein
MRARIAAYARWSKEPDPTRATERGRQNGPGSITYWERKVDPEGVWPPDRRRKAADAAMREHFTRLAYKSSRARQRKRSGR